MKNTDKITLTIGQLKRLVKESKVYNKKRIIKESVDRDSLYMMFYQGINRYLYFNLKIKLNDANRQSEILNQWKRNPDTIPYIELCKSILRDDGNAYIDPTNLKLLKDFIKGIGNNSIIKAAVKKAVNERYSQITDVPKTSSISKLRKNVKDLADEDEDDDEFPYATWDQIFDYLERYEDSIEDIQEIAEDPDGDADRFFNYYGSMLENGIDVAPALQHIAKQILAGKTIKELRRMSDYQGEI